ncbi:MULTISPECIES: FUSC family protein [unclassified Caballeronia]|uniref:FUSC family protein n=1 Tax=unclassified Caballeronia TaxID=2646786 RepID=UPI002866526F|nr:MULTISPECIES: FUSC family protein [unclassified Caballeronia]MDR5738837.1 FUSC family protein [Caballeronia sp. LZ016]MDR5811295.1 FUSC family protein [Caballeronia sp. LZ019]
MASSTSASLRKGRAKRLWHGLTSPFFRYRHAKTIHAVRVALGMATSFLVTTGIDVPHGVWASVSLIVVIGGLQHYGNIRKKAAERAIGTALGAAIGLALILVHILFGSLTLFFLLMSAIAGACAYYAIGKAGYVALLTAITMVIVAGHGDSPFDVGLWRTANVLIGIAIALAFSFVLPQYATYSWRYRLADNLRECARLYGALLDGKPLIAEETTRRFLVMSQRLVQARALMDSVAKETRVPLARLEEIQRLHRSILAALEMLATSMPETSRTANDGNDTTGLALGGSPREQRTRHKLLQMARALRFGRVGLLYVRADESAKEESGEGESTQHGMHWLAMRFDEQVDRLRLRLSEIERQWNIEGARPYNG